MKKLPPDALMTELVGIGDADCQVLQATWVNRLIEELLIPTLLSSGLSQEAQDFGDCLSRQAPLGDLRLAVLQRFMRTTIAAPVRIIASRIVSATRPVVDSGDLGAAALSCYTSYLDVFPGERGEELCRQEQMRQIAEINAIRRRESAQNTEDLQ